MRFQVLNREVGSETLRLRAGIELQIDPKARHGFEAYCWWWPEMVEELDSFLATSLTKGTLVDVGALHGLFSLAFCYGRRDVRAFAIEPGQAGCHVIYRHVRMNGIDNVSLINIAVSDRAGNLDMTVNGPHLEAVPGGLSPTDMDQIVRCPVTTLDRLCKELRIHPDLIKIDVEGYEFNVLLGAERVLREHRPTLFLELHPAEMARFGHTTVELVSLLAGMGYQFEDLRRRPIPPNVLQSSSDWSHLICEQR
jgi:FkbM family methyltransferase